MNNLVQVIPSNKSKITNILKYPGSKWNIADWIVSHFPMGYEKMNYLEPFFGSGSIFFTKNRSVLETINDLDENVVNLFRVCRDYPEQLAKAVYLTPWSRTEYKRSYETIDEPVEKARRYLVRMWQAIGAKSSNSTGWRKNIKGVNGNVTRFHLSLPENILSVVQRLKHSEGSHIVQIENKNAFELIKNHNEYNTLIYADPPYVLKTRNGRIYKHEFTDEDHRYLLDILRKHKGPVVISGYKNEIYDVTLNDWFRYEISARTEAQKIKIEVLWCNYEADRQITLDD